MLVSLICTSSLVTNPVSFKEAQIHLLHLRFLPLPKDLGIAVKKTICRYGVREISSFLYK